MERHFFLKLHKASSVDFFVISGNPDSPRKS